MKKKVFYLMSMALIVFSSVGVMKTEAQVVIGKNTAPHPGAVLELETSKGLLLSKVSLTDARSFGFDKKESAVGMLVYNTNPDMQDLKGGKGEGLYVWNGENWTLITSTGAKAEKEGTVNGPNGTYRTYTFEPATGLGTWMVDNSKEGTSAFQSSDAAGGDGSRGYFYEYNNANSACPNGYELPTERQWEALGAYINSLPDSNNEKKYWINSSSLAGMCFTVNLGGSHCFSWDTEGRWWMADSNSNCFSVSENSKTIIKTGNGSLAPYTTLSVRCVKKTN